MKLVRGNKTIIWLVVFSVAIAILSAVLLFPGRDEKWAYMTKRLAQLKAEARSRTVSRSVLRGIPRPGNAWDEYQIALDEALTVKEHQNGAPLTRFLAGDTKVDRAKVEQMVAAHPAVVEHLRLGAQSADGQYPYKWEDGNLMALPSLLASRLSALLAVSQAKIWAEGGRTEDAADLLLDVSVFARDLASNGPLLSGLIGDAIYLITFDELRNLVLSGKLTRTQLADLEKKLEILDRDFPSLGATLTNETLGTDVEVMGTSGEEQSVRQRLSLAKQGGWRYGFSSQRMAADAFAERESYAQRSQNFDQMDFASAKKEAEAITAEATASENPMVRMSMPNLSKVVVSHRDALARLRLLRAATGFLATGKVPAVEDPFGKNLLWSQEAGKLKIWSVGSDGENQNGRGAWTKAPGQEDIVLEISK